MVNANIPIGTKIVTRVESDARAGHPSRPVGSVGVVVQVPTNDSDLFRIRFSDGAEADFHRHHLAILKHFQRGNQDTAQADVNDVDLYDYVIYRCVIGSVAYGLDEPGSDVDRRGIYLPPAEQHWSLAGVPEQLENAENEECYWEIQKFLTLALKANPNVLECLYTPMVELATPLAEELLSMRSAFLSRLVYQTYNGYVLSQFKKLEQDLRTRGALRWKHVMHLIRLLLSGITVLREGFVVVRIEDHREQLLAIRRGEIPWEAIDRWRLSLHKEFEAAFNSTRLPEQPDYRWANAFLVKARRSAVNRG